MLLVAAAVAGEPISANASSHVAGGIGGGLDGLVDPNSVGANGEVGEDDRIGDEILDNADDIDKLLQLGPGAGIPKGKLGIPGVMLEAYMRAAQTLATAQPNCNLDWPLLASIGRIESNHARGGRVNAAGDTTPQILGPVLNGGGFAAIRDSDGGRFDGDNRWDRAVGAMQFIPSTWRGYSADGNADGRANPHNIFDATLAAGKYLCSGGMDLSNSQDRAAAVFRYNRSNTYVATVLLWANAYAKGVNPLPSSTGPGPGNVALGPQPTPNLPNTPPGTTAPPPGNSNPPGSGSTPTRTTTTTTPGVPSKTTPPCGPQPSPSSPSESPTSTTTPPDSSSDPSSTESPTSTTTTPPPTTTPTC